jgi:3-deoxy-7-phosphoheptulonate synthase
MRHSTDDLRIREIKELAPPSHVLREFPESDRANDIVFGTRQSIHRILARKDDRLLVVVGPCSIHDPAAAREYAGRLLEQRDRLKSSLEIVMRVYFEKPRTTVGWKGLINDPNLDGSFQINKGLRVARELLLDINELGVPAGTEFLDMITPQYIADLVSWGAIGARTTESQVHRELASGLSCPVGFKNGTDGNIRIACDAIKAASRAHHFLSVTKAGHSAIVATTGNEDCHVILRGGSRPNYDRESIDAACATASDAGIECRLMIDASHGNSSKDYRRQRTVVTDVARQVGDGERRIFGLMVESHLTEGRQELGDGGSLIYGQSVTDACLGWEDTIEVMDELAAAVDRRRGLQASQPTIP